MSYPARAEGLVNSTITKTIQLRRIRNVGHCCRRKDELISEELLWTPLHEQEKDGRPARTYIQQLCSDRECSLEDKERLTIKTDGEWGLGRSLPVARHDDYDKKDSAIHNLRCLICHKTKPNKTKPNHIYIWYICIKIIWHLITYNFWYAIKSN